MKQNSSLSREVNDKIHADNYLNQAELYVKKNTKIKLENRISHLVWSLPKRWDNINKWESIYFDYISETWLLIKGNLIFMDKWIIVILGWFAPLTFEYNSFFYGIEDWDFLETKVTTNEKGIEISRIPAKLKILAFLTWNKKYFNNVWNVNLKWNEDFWKAFINELDKSFYNPIIALFKKRIIIVKTSNSKNEVNNTKSLIQTYIRLLNIKPTETSIALNFIKKENPNFFILNN